MKTKKLLITYLVSSLIYLSAQQLLNVFTYWSNIKLELETFSPHTYYFISPAVSAVLIISSYFILRRTYHPQKEHYLLHVILWLFLFIPQIIPPFFYGLNTIYTTWTFVLATTATGTVVFQDFVLINVDDVPKNGRKFIYNELKFYLDKFSFAWLTLGTVLAICITILWMAPITSFKMLYDERVFWSVYMVFCFLTVTILLYVFAVYPLFKSIRKVRDAILKPDGETDIATSDNSG